MYGGTCPAAHIEGHLRGLSPRVRGNPATSGRTNSGPGSIPACTGEPQSARDPARTPRVYPRVYGGTYTPSAASVPHDGLSPRVRGNPFGVYHRATAQGSIPACTGEPCAALDTLVLRTVYPRVYGGTGIGRSGCVICSRVYPRVYGGTMFGRTSTDARHGLSPRVRGNPRLSRLSSDQWRSIPACTGEPVRLRRGMRTGRVYPRVYGGTRSHYARKRRGKGLSPRVRGNRGVVCGDAYKRRSIPACTGEPSKPALVRISIKVYPRVYGGTGHYETVAEHAAGLSPRVRGNPRSSMP